LVYVTAQGLNRKLLNSDAPPELIPNTTNCRYPVFSPDGKLIAFERITGNELMKIYLQGGKPTHITNLGSDIAQITFIIGLTALLGTIYATRKLLLRDGSMILFPRPA